MAQRSSNEKIFEMKYSKAHIANLEVSKTKLKE